MPHPHPPHPTFLFPSLVMPVSRGLGWVGFGDRPILPLPSVLARGRLQEMAIGLVQGRMLDILSSVNDCIDHVPPVGTEYEFEVRGEKKQKKTRRSCLRCNRENRKLRYA